MWPPTSTPRPSTPLLKSNYWLALGLRLKLHTWLMEALWLSSLIVPLGWVNSDSVTKNVRKAWQASLEKWNPVNLAQQYLGFPWKSSPLREILSPTSTLKQSVWLSGALQSQRGTTGALLRKIYSLNEFNQLNIGERGHYWPSLEIPDHQFSYSKNWQSKGKNYTLILSLRLIR